MSRITDTDAVACALRLIASLLDAMTNLTIRFVTRPIVIPLFLIGVSRVTPLPSLKLRNTVYRGWNNVGSSPNSSTTA